MELFAAVTGKTMSREQFDTVGDRIFNLIRCFWIREHGEWDRTMDYPPARWFEESLADKGPEGRDRIDKKKYDHLLSQYYDQRGWDDSGVPKQTTLHALDLMQYLSKDDQIGERNPV